MQDVQPPRFIELSQRDRRRNRIVWAALVGSWVVSLVCALAFYASAVKLVPVVVVDGKGQPVLFDDTLRGRLHMEPVRIEYFAEQFLRRYVGIDSANLKEDLTEALNMMTPRWREVVKQDGREFERRRAYQDANLKTVFPDTAFNVNRYDPDDPQATLYMYACGRMQSVPKFGELDGPLPKEATQWFLTELKLLREPITKQNIHGLAVDYAHTYVFATEDEYKLFVLKRQS